MGGFYRIRLSISASWNANSTHGSIGLSRISRWPREVLYVPCLISDNVTEITVPFAITKILVLTINTHGKLYSFAFCLNFFWQNRIESLLLNQSQSYFRSSTKKFQFTQGFPLVDTERFVTFKPKFWRNGKHPRIWTTFRHLFDVLTTKLSHLHAIRCILFFFLDSRHYWWWCWRSYASLKAICVLEGGLATFRSRPGCSLDQWERILCLDSHLKRTDTTKLLRHAR